jgi:hypothetical protein
MLHKVILCGGHKSELPPELVSIDQYTNCLQFENYTQHRHMLHQHAHYLITPERKSLEFLLSYIRAIDSLANAGSYRHLVSREAEPANFDKYHNSIR